MEEGRIHWGQFHRLAAWLAQVQNAAMHDVLSLSDGLSGELGRQIVRWLSVAVILVSVGVCIAEIGQGAIPVSLSLFVIFFAGLFGFRLSFHWEVNQDE